MSKTVTIGTPHNGDITPEYVIALFNLFFTSKTACKLNLFESALVHQARNKIFLDCKDDYLLFIDTDMVFPTDGLSQLIALDKDIVGGLYFSRKDAAALVFNLNEHGRYRHIIDIPSQPFLCDSVATGFMLIKQKVIQKFRDEIGSERLKSLPFDFIRFDKDYELGEDMAFCRRARELGFEVWCDPTIELLHIGKKYVNREWFDTYKEIARENGQI